MTSKHINVCAFTLYDMHAASTRYRVAQYIDGLRDADINLEIIPFFSESYVPMTFLGERYPVITLLGDYLRRLAALTNQKRFDAALVHLELFPLLPGFIEAGLIKSPYIYDMDDAFFLKYSEPRFKWIAPILHNKFDSVVRRASAILAGNNYLAEYGRERNHNTKLLPTVVDMKRYKPIPKKQNGIFTVGWIGSPSTSVYLNLLKKPLARLGAEGPLRFIVVGGHSDPIDNVEVTNVRWSENTEVQLINSFDVGVMPLFDDPWARGKCAFKLIQYMACGVPAVASPVGANVEVVGLEGGLLAVDEAEWVQTLRRLRDVPELRIGVGSAGRARVERHYSLSTALPIMINTIVSVVGREPISV